MCRPLPRNEIPVIGDAQSRAVATLGEGLAPALSLARPGLALPALPGQTCPATR